jgi:hypothetical protein
MCSKAYPNLMKYARVLLGHCPRETTQLFIDYYTGRYRPKKDAELPEKAEAQPSSAVHNLAALLPLPYMGTGGTKAPPSSSEVASEEEKIDAAPTYEIPKPRTAFSAFVDHPDEFITFLEALITQESLKKEDKIDLYTTLFEMYLDTAKRKKDASERQEWENKAKNLIEGKDVRTPSTPEHCYAPDMTVRYLSQRPTSSYSQIYPTFEREQHSSGSKKGCVLTYSVPILQQRTLRV